MPNPAAKLAIRKDQALIREFPLTQTEVNLGRSPDNQLVLSDDLSVSRHHAQFKYSGNAYAVTDLNSSDGTYVNGIQLAPHTPRSLVAGDQVRIGKYEIILAIAAPVPIPAQSPVPVSAQKTTISGVPEAGVGAPPTQSRHLDLKGRDTFTLGRDPLNDMEINHPSVSRFHAQIKKQDGSYIVLDLNSTNGTFLNGKQIAGHHPLRVGDSIRVGPTNLVFNLNETLLHSNEEGNLRIDAIGLNKQINKDLNLLQDISLSIQAREFVVIAGVSGGGKSTLLDALNGFRPATSGNVLVNGTDLYRNFNAYRNQIGYVPQRDIVHMELTVEQALDFAAQLRMPNDTTRAERKMRVSEVLKDLGLEHRRSVPIKSLSGGQIKRVSIGVELLTKPSLFYLDEATSGLDPGTEAELMQLLRELADQGRTILLITHATDNVTMCDQVVFMARGGYLAYYGPPKEAPGYFGVEKFNQIYSKVEHELSPQEWQQRYQQSPLYQKYVAQRQQSLGASGTQRGAKRLKQQLPGAQVKTISSWKQFLILSKRNIAILMRDRVSLMLMLAVAPILGMLDLVTWSQPLFGREDGSANLALTMLFTTILFSVMVGALPTMREIVKEVDIYSRERIIGLQIIPYVFSKVWVSVLLALYQGGVFLLFKVIAIPDLPSEPGILVGMYFTITLSVVAGMLLGLLGSAAAPNQSVAPILVLVFLIPQIIFGGGVLPIDTFGPPGKVLNQLSLTKWPFEALSTLSKVGVDVAEDPCWQDVTSGKVKEVDAIEEERKKSCDCMGKSVFKTCNFPGILAEYDKSVDEPEPVKPKQPTGAAAQSPDAFDKFEKDLEEYQTAFRDWSSKRNKALGNAEGLINGINEQFSNAFKVNVNQHLGIFGIFIFAIFALTLVVQKAKDFF
ncbi:FHA domain-containing protein [Acaryochloris sp. 'Moss Beach']|uniref:FHA domain-containing protein n=1 Tax=Acaryochloris sp. 'Moss Beach' TaxID=2740837 RepID=UPI001F4878B0|nr:FHA domain-containing protein [Acaryochloris sp. 'Moss Beach']UJB71047.1 FHA domain-containing protein [Acaryochloris sp. 'Moss Beach']